MRIAHTRPFILAACAEQPSVSLPQAGLGNQAALYCAQQGGRVEILHSTQGDTELCLLPDGKAVNAES